MTQKRRIGYLTVTALILMGCRITPLVVELPPSYKGTVEIECGPSMDPSNRTVRIDITGHGAMSPCPKRGTPIVIKRDGQEIQPVGRIDYQATGDGIIVDINFVVQ